MGSKPFSLRLPEEVKKDLDFVSAKTKRSASSIAIEAIGNDVAVRAKRMRMIEEAKEEAKKGEFISQSAMEAWVDSLGTDNELPPPEPDIIKKKSQ